ncbi:hypothetical protein AJ80_07854 [Polytolypa hystricis UAMH7299]|uniref:Uncharacterized protein n=1 Tax=Polytolypa hystricis (strain UAMH7299) TaxID=1447883 RepID=A0A2B7XHQ8_POLH7|nr:hypothetical protein AJ80_07854 [Polytolypa hystricis UAMH7299]
MTACSGVQKAAKANDASLARKLLAEWQTDPYLVDLTFGNIPLDGARGYLESALITAVENKNREFVKLLLSNGASMTEKVLVGLIDRELDFDHEEVKDILRDFVANGWDVNSPFCNAGFRFPILYARETPALFNWLLGQGASPNVKSQRGDAAVTFCAQYLTPSHMKKLFDHGASVDNNALHQAIRCESDSSCVTMLSLLFDNGADVNALEEQRGRPRGSKIFEPIFQSTPLYTAAQRDDYEAAKLLIERGANPHTRTLRDGKEYMSGLDSMRSSENEDIVRLAEEKFGPATKEEIEMRDEILASFRVL